MTETYVQILLSLSDAEVNENGIESICVELTIAKCKTVISCVYKHPKVPNDVFMKCITKITDSVLCYSSDCVLIGEMNCCPTRAISCGIFVTSMA